MHILKTITLMFLSLIFVLSLSAALTGMSMQVLLYPEVYENTLDKHNAYAFIEEQIKQGGYIPETIFAKKSTKDLVNGIIRNTLAYLRGDKEQLNATIELGDTIMEFFEKQAAEFPVCAPGEEPYIGEEIACRPPGIEPNVFLKEVLEKKGIDSSQFTSVNLADVYDKQGKIVELREGISTFKKAIAAAFILSIIILLLTIYLTRKSLLQMTEVIDIDLLQVSFCMFLTSYMIEGSIGKITASLPAQLNFAEAFLTDIIFAILKIMKYYGGLVIAAAVAWTITAIIIGIFRKIFKPKQLDNKNKLKVPRPITKNNKK